MYSMQLQSITTDVGDANIPLSFSASPFWRSRDDSIVSWSQREREEDDEEALRWAALEKLPTYNRVRKGILAFAEGNKEIDVKSLTPQERRRLLERLVRVTEEDNERFLLKLRDRVDRYELLKPVCRI